MGRIKGVKPNAYADGGGGGGGLGDPGANGIVVRTTTNTTTARTIVGTSPISVSNGNGVSDNPTIAVNAATTSAAGIVELATDGETAGGVVVQGNDSRLSNSRAPTAHASSHQNGGSDEIATATPAADAIPKANGSGLLDAWISAATTLAKGLIQLAGDLGGTATSPTVVQARGLRESGGTTLTMGAVGDGDGLARVGTEITGVSIGQVSSLNAAAKFWFQIRMDGSAGAGVGTAVLVGQVTGTITYRTASSVAWPDVGLAGTAAGGYCSVRTNNQICRPDQSARHSFALLCSSGTTNLRVWCAIGSIGGGDTPSGAAMGLVYNPNVGPNWQVFCYSGSGSVYYADTGHAYTANERVEVSFLATSSGCTGKIRTAGGTWSAEQTVTSGVPSSSTPMYHIFTVSRITGGTTAAATAYFVGSSAEVSYA